MQKWFVNDSSICLNLEKANCNNLGSVCSVLFMSEYLQVLKACFVKKHFLRLHQLFFS